MIATIAKYSKLRLYAINPVALSVVFIYAVHSSLIAYAEPITLLTSPNSLAGDPGSEVTFSGTITNTTGFDLRATELFFNFSGFDSARITPTQILGDPDFLIPNGQTSPIVNLFSVAIASPAESGTAYPINSFLQDVYGNLSNTVTTTVIAGDPVPEPTSILLLCTGLASAIAIRQKRRSASRQTRQQDGSDNPCAMHDNSTLVQPIPESYYLKVKARRASGKVIIAATSKLDFGHFDDGQCKQNT